MKKRRGHFWLDVTACFLIPAYTLLFAGSVEWFGSNFSVIAVRGENYYWGFVGWGLLTGGYFLVMLVRLAGSLPRRGAQAGVLLLTALGSLSLGYALIIPYLPDHFPRYATLHVLLAALACVLLMGALLVTLLALRREEKGKWQGPFLVGHCGRFRNPVFHSRYGIHCPGGLFHHLSRPADPAHLSAVPGAGIIYATPPAGRPPGALFSYWGRTWLTLRTVLLA